MTELFNKKQEKEKRRNLRFNQTFAEKTIWSHLRRKQLGVRFRRQFGIGTYVVDFYCPKKYLIIEIDGDTHFEVHQIEYDLKRSKYFESLGMKVVRFTNQEIYQDLDRVLLTIRNLIN